jgi:hypothetical protein
VGAEVVEVVVSGVLSDCNFQLNVLVVGAEVVEVVVSGVLSDCNLYPMTKARQQNNNHKNVAVFFISKSYSWVIKIKKKPSLFSKKLGFLNPLT